jgi:hypothetical protein
MASRKRAKRRTTTAPEEPVVRIREIRRALGDIVSDLPGGHGVPIRWQLLDMMTDVLALIAETADQATQRRVVAMAHARLGTTERDSSGLRNAQCALAVRRGIEDIAKYGDDERLYPLAAIHVVDEISLHWPEADAQRLRKIDRTKIVTWLRAFTPQRARGKLTLAAITANILHAARIVGFGDVERATKRIDKNLQRDLSVIEHRPKIA